MIVKKYTDYLSEAIEIEGVESKLGNDYIELKKDLIENIEKTLNRYERKPVLNDLIEFLEDYKKGGKDSTLIDDLIEDRDIFDFYMKNQSDIDEILTKNNFFDNPPQKYNVYGLYSVVIEGTKESILMIIDILLNELGD